METSIDQNEVVFIVFLGCAVMLLLAVSLLLFYHIHRRKIADKALAMERQELQHQEALLQHNIVVQEEERKRIAKDLHDEVGSRLSLGLLHVGQLQQAIDHQPEEQLQQIRTILNGAIQSTRQLSHSLMPPVLEEFGLEQALRELVEQVPATAGVKLTFATNGVAIKRGSAVELGLFRIAQELLTNTLKHAAATAIHLQLEETALGVQFTYSDNGKGMDWHLAMQQGGMGLKNIEHRIQMIPATHSIHTAPGQGMQVQITVNTNNHQHEKH